MGCDVGPVSANFQLFVFENPDYSAILHFEKPADFGKMEKQPSAISHANTMLT